MSGLGHFQDFRPGFRFWHICHVDRHGHFTLKQLRLPVVNETHTNSYTGPRLNLVFEIFICNFYLKQNFFLFAKQKFPAR